MKILMVGDIWTHPIDRGNKRLIVDQTKYLQSLGHEIHYLLVDSVWRRRSLNIIPMQQFWGDKLHIVKASFLRRFLIGVKNYISHKFKHGEINADTVYFNDIHKKINIINSKEKFDICIINYFYLSKCIPNIYIPCIALQTHDVFADRNKEAVCMSTSYIEEKKAISRAKHIFCVQANEAEYFSKLAPKSNIYTLYTNFKYVSEPIIGGANLLFLSGPADFNIMGLQWFIDNVWYSIKNIYPSVKLIIGGGICNKLSYEQLPKDIILYGYVDNPEVFYNQGDIVINPTYLGTGLKIKCIEALAYDKVILTRLKNKIGLYDKVEIPIIFSDDAEEWTNTLSMLLNSPDLIKEVKNKNVQYMKDFSEYINHQYSNFINCVNRKDCH